MTKSQDEDKLRWRQIKRLFDVAVELDQDERGAWLVAQCGDDRELLAKLQSLLERDEERSSFLQPPLKAGDETQRLDDGSARLGRRVGAFTLNRVIASGGMGTVYEATQEQPRRTVAVKLMRPGITSRSALRRFEYESQLLGHLRHPGIAQVYDAGTHRDGNLTVPFFAMEYIVGAKSLTDYAREKTLGTRERMALFTNVCEAVQHGHQKGIIHRDLKPSNILVDSSGQVKIIDFGVARSTDSDSAITTLYTDVAQLIGTLQYMSPEQCAADPHDIDTRSDVYALGVVFYELLCGRLPYEIKNAPIHEATRVIREQEPAKLSSLNRALRGDIETIAVKALDKDRDRRYQSASAFAADINRYLNNETISARPPSVIYQLRVFARRNKGFFLAVAAVFLVLIAGVVVSTAQYHRADAARLEAMRRAEELEQVARFQEEHLSGIDVPTMGIRLHRGVLDKARTVVGRAGKEDVDNRLAQLETLLTRVDFTGLLLNLLDENIFARAVDTIDDQFASQPLVRARLQQAMAETVMKLGLLDRAMAPQKTALEIRRRILPDEHPDTFRSIDGMGELFWRMGKYAEAERYWREALEGRRRVVGDDHPSTLNSVNNMGMLLKSMGKYDEAEPYLRDALERKRRVLGDDHLETLISLNNMGSLLKKMGKNDEAAPYLLEALERKRRVLGDDHPSTLNSINNMGLLLREMGKYAEAEPLYREAMETRRRMLGDDHADTMVSINNLAVLLSSMGKYAEAERYCREALERKRRVLGDDHPDTLLAINSLGFLIQSMGKYAEAEPAFREALERRRRVLGDDHPDTLISINNMGYLLNKLGRHDDAADLLLAGEAAARRIYVEGNTRGLGTYLVKLGEARTGQGEYSAAEETLLEAHTLLTASFGEEHRRTKYTVNQLIMLYEAWDAAEPGKGHAEKALAWREKRPKARAGKNAPS